MKNLKENTAHCSIRLLIVCLIFGFSWSACLRAQNASEYNDNIPLPGTPANSAGFGGGVLNNVSNTGTDNSAIGKDALNANGAGNDWNTAVGNNALKNNAGDHNTAAGFEALTSNTSGTGNTAVGFGALKDNTTGNNNSALGYEAMANITSGTFNSAFGSGADVTSGQSYLTTIGYQAFPGTIGSDIITFGDANVTVIEGEVLPNYASDRRFKDNIVKSGIRGLDFIKRLRPVVYNLDVQKITKHTIRMLPAKQQEKYLRKDFTEALAIRRSGFIAQEVEQAANAAGFEFRGLTKPGEKNDLYSLSYSQFVLPLVIAVQEQQQMIENFEKDVSEEYLAIDALSTNLRFKAKTDARTETVAGFSMEANRPNPFKNETVIEYSLPEKITSSELVISDLSGQRIKSYNLSERGKGSITITSEKLLPGIYVYSILGDGKFLGSKRMVVSK